MAGSAAAAAKQAVADSAASTKTMNTFRNMGESAEKPERFQCRTAAPAREVSRRVRLSLIMGHPEAKEWLALVWTRRNQGSCGLPTVSLTRRTQDRPYQVLFFLPLL